MVRFARGQAKKPEFVDGLRGAWLTQCALMHRPCNRHSQVSRSVGPRDNRDFRLSVGECFRIRCKSQRVNQLSRKNEIDALAKTDAWESAVGVGPIQGSGHGHIGAAFKLCDPSGIGTFYSHTWWCRFAQPPANRYEPSGFGQARSTQIQPCRLPVADAADGQSGLPALPPRAKALAHDGQMRPAPGHKAFGFA